MSFFVGLAPSSRLLAQRVLAILLFCIASGLGMMQPASAQPAQETAAPVLEPRALLEAARLDLRQVEASLQREGLDEKRLADLKARLEPLGLSILELIAREQPRADDVKARIDQLGPAPDAAKGQSESVDVARDRADQQKQFREIDETLRLARALSLRAEQAGQTVSERRRELFAKQILERHSSIVSPWLWLDLGSAFPADALAFHNLARHWGETILTKLDWYEAVLLGILGLAGFFAAPFARRWVATGSFISADDARGEAPSRMQKLMRALRMVALNTLAPAIFLLVLHDLLAAFELLPGRLLAVMGTVLSGLAFLAFINGLTTALLSPHHASWRLIGLSDRAARAFWRNIRLLALIATLGRIIESVYSAIVASLPLTQTTKGVLAILVALVLIRAIRQAFPSGTGDADHDNAHQHGHFSLRLAIWSAAILLLGAALMGYLPFAGFLVVQVVWLISLAMVGFGLLALIDEMIGSGLSAEGMFGRRVRGFTGLTATALDQTSVLLSGLGRVVLLIIIAMLALAPWGVDSSNFLGTVRGAFFGFQVGGVTISLAAIALAIILFVAGYVITRAIQSWLATRYLPKTQLDPGLRNSIQTIFGYIGIVIAAMLALGQLGLSLDKLTIVAGALSVGIGFGLQSIVNNFVSGLILLWERPIRVGDTIVVGEEQGKVKQINVRSTEIETFDRASLIIPNSEFISGRVKNWMHADRTGRIIVPVSVDYESDPDAVRQVLLDAALAHPEVLSEPGPMVIFKTLGESGLDFELRCFVDVDVMGGTRSDLLFDIFRRLKEGGIAIPYPTRRLEITNLPPFVDPRSLTKAGESDRD